MNKVAKIDLYGLKNNEYLGLMGRLLEYAETITTAEILPAITAFKVSVNTLNKHLTDNYNETLSKTAQRINEERIAAYNALRYCVKGLFMSPNAEKAAVGAKYWHIVENTEDPRRANQESVSVSLGAIIVAFRAFDAAELAAYAVDDYVATLEARQKEFAAAARTRDQETDARIEKATFKYRKDCYNAFYALAYHAYSRATNNDDKECYAFVEQANGALDHFKRQLKIRRALAKKDAEAAKSGNASSTTEQSANSTSTASSASTVENVNSTENMTDVPNENSSETTVEVVEPAATVVETEQIETEKAVA